jgi:hypothetical protein
VTISNLSCIYPYYPIDFRIYAPDGDGKTKNEHFREVFLAAIKDKKLKALIILFDSWEASVENLKLIETEHRANQLVSTSPDTDYRQCLTVAQLLADLHAKHGE